MKYVRDAHDLYQKTNLQRAPVTPVRALRKTSANTKERTAAVYSGFHSPVCQHQSCTQHVTRE